MGYDMYADLTKIKPVEILEVRFGDAVDMQNFEDYWLPQRNTTPHPSNLSNPSGVNLGANENTATITDFPALKKLRFSGLPKPEDRAISTLTQMQWYLKRFRLDGHLGVESIQFGRDP
jgi:hypothetical protein